MLHIISVSVYRWSLDTILSARQATGVILNGIHQLRVFAADVNLADENINTIKKNTEVLDVSNEVGLEVNTEN
jgi:hypothetical protein